MQATVNPIMETYSRLAKTYDDDLNQKSCWGRAAKRAWASLIIKDYYQLVLDVGCGTGRALWHLACNSRPGIQFIGVDPGRRKRYPVYHPSVARDIASRIGTQAADCVASSPSAHDIKSGLASALCQKLTKLIVLSQ